MNVTSRSRYAFKIMIDLAKKGQGFRAERVEIAQTHNIPQTYLDQILLRLKKAHLIESFRGRRGGYFLSKPPQSISALEIIEAVEDHIAPVPCLAAHELCANQVGCVSKTGWQLVFSAMKNSVAHISLEELVQSEAPTPPKFSLAQPVTELISKREEKRKQPHQNMRSTAQ